MNKWKNYLKTALITFTLAGPPVGVAYSYHKAQDQIERAGLMLARNYHLKEELLDDIRVQKGWHLCGMETVGVHQEVYQEVRQTPEYRQWENTIYQGEKRALDNLLCNPPLSTELGLVAITLHNLFQGNIIKALDGRLIGNDQLANQKSYYCDDS